MKYSLPEMTHTFQIQTKGNETGTNWVGTFKYKRPTLGMRSRIAQTEARLNGEVQNLDSEIEDFNYAVSYLRHTLIEYPDWWVESGFGFDLYDASVINELFNKTMDFEAEWKKKIHSGNEKDVKDEVSDEVKEFARPA